MSSYRAPHIDPEPWDSVIFTDVKKQSVTLPPRRKVGNVVVSLPSKVKIDSKTAAGKKGATVTRQGAKDAPTSIEFEFDARYWEEVEAALAAIDPRGPSLGGPFLLTCPNLPNKYEAIQIEEISPRGTAMIRRGVGRCKITGKECSFPKSGGTGGVVKKGPLTAAEKEALVLYIEGLKRLAAKGGALAALGNGTQADYLERAKAQEALLKQISQLQKQLDEGSAVPEAPATETTTPTAPGSSIGKGIDDIFDQIHNPTSYRPSSNPQAPKNAPDAVGAI
jgi:hypothetical protein